MKTIHVEVADENVEFFTRLVEELKLGGALPEPTSVPEAHKSILDERLAEDKPELDKPAETFFAKYGQRGI